jgi:hypothetical protein
MTYLPKCIKKLKNDRFISQIFKKIVPTENLLPHMPLLQDIAACLITLSNLSIFNGILLAIKSGIYHQSMANCKRVLFEVI